MTDKFFPQIIIFFLIFNLISRLEVGAFRQIFIEHDENFLLR